MRISELAKKYGLPESTVRTRIRYGIPLDAPRVTARERGLRSWAAREKQWIALDDRVVAGTPHPWHRLIAKMAVKPCE